MTKKRFTNSTSPAYVEPTLDGWAHDVLDGRIFLGSQQSARDLAALQEKNITAIVNCTLYYPHRFEKDGEGICYCRIAVSDEPSANILVWLDGAADFIHHHLQQGTNAVLVHCQMGVSRSATVVLAYLIKYHDEYNTVKEALLYLLSQRPQVRPNHGFEHQLEVYAQRVAKARNAAVPNNDSTITGNTPPAIDLQWAETSNVRFQTLQGIMDDDWSELFQDVIITFPESEILLVALDYLFGRGLIDLGWFVALIRSFPSNVVKTELKRLLLDQEQSPFLEQWAGEVYS